MVALWGVGEGIICCRKRWTKKLVGVGGGGGEC